MEETAIKSAQHLLNYGVLGVVTILLICAFIWFVKHYLTREKYHENDKKEMNKQQMELTIQFTKMAEDFKNSSNRHADVVDELKNIIHSKL